MTAPRYKPLIDKSSTASIVKSELKLDISNSIDSPDVNSHLIPKVNYPKKESLLKDDKKPSPEISTDFERSPLYSKYKFGGCSQ